MAEQKTELERNAMAEARRKEQENCQRTKNMKNMDNHTEDSKMGSCLGGIDQEAAMEMDCQETHERAYVMVKEELLQGNLAKKFNKKLRKHEKFSQYGQRQKDRPQTREKSKQLHTFLASHTQQLQGLAKEHKRMQEKVYEARLKVLTTGLDLERSRREEYENFIKVVSEEERGEMEKAKEMFDKKQAYKEFLMEELVKRHQQKHADFDEKLMDARMMNEIQKEMQETAVKEQTKKKDKKNKLHKERLAQIALEQQFKAQKIQEMIDEELRRQKIVEQVDKMRKEQEAQEAAKRQKNEEAAQSIAEKIQKLEIEKKEREDLIKDLQEQEELERQYSQERHERDQAAAAMHDLKESLLSQMEDNEKAKQKEKERDQEMRQKLESELRAEKLTEAAKFDKAKDLRKKYAEELKQQMKENKERKAKEKKAEAKREDKTKEQDKINREAQAEAQEKILQNVSEALEAGHKTLEECRNLPIYKKLATLNNKNTNKKA